MATQKFSALDLDELIKDCTGQVDQISTELATYDSAQVVPRGNPETNQLINKNGQAVDFSRVYSAIEKLIENGNNALETLAAVDPDTIEPTTIYAMTSLMNSIKGCIAEFTKVHTIHLKHQLNLEMERTRQQHRLDLITARANAKKEAENTDNQNATTMIEFTDYSTNDIFKYLQKEKEKREKKE